ncbi:proteasome beta subunit [Actinoalloteichus hoggarensis]|uniref:Proteasome subunit beta n=1 Tax=Actinoalloteichus hoggarensis TaxID=1470176 RepID=A0A221W524_9PSEU|nr:proteasome subunit beta [Actinoalloteichus hoggarensis]ASO20958.1 Proteasome subunit beta precursor [Actinoalloteichus hoggarensis]MBB5920889.1 proteasome beta subunit [Actinoalloteichus hoggarensis]
MTLRAPQASTNPHAALMSIGGSSFYQLVREHAPQTLPQYQAGGADPEYRHGTTVLALHYRDGVIMAGDRRATMGNLIAQRDLRKVEPADSHSGIAFAGAVGVAIRMVALFQVELRHYEKIEGVELSLPAKVNRISVMMRGNLPQAMQGLAVVPLFAGWDHHEGAARIFTFDIAGSTSEKTDFGGAGSGSQFALSSLKKLYRPGLSRDEAVRIMLESLVDAADDDTATGGPDATHGRYPVVAAITEGGYSEIAEDELATLASPRD